MTEKTFTCADCQTLACKNNSGAYPKFCLSAGIDGEKLREVVELYKTDDKVREIALTAAEIEGKFYGAKTRVEETIEFILRTNPGTVGIATCVGLMGETRSLAKIFDKYGIGYHIVGCKLGAIDKSEIGVPDENKINRGCAHESMCNPIMQAEILNELKTGLNIIMGLCVGHDMLFSMYSKAPVTTLVVKDRVLAHNSVGALYTSESMYSRFKG